VLVTLSDVKRGGIIIANSGAFTDKNLAKAGYKIPNIINRVESR
jgi:hypothetical protein